MVRGPAERHHVPGDHRPGLIEARDLLHLGDGTDGHLRHRHWTIAAGRVTLCRYATKVQREKQKGCLGWAEIGEDIGSMRRSSAVQRKTNPRKTPQNIDAPWGSETSKDPLSCIGVKEHKTKKQLAITPLEGGGVAVMGWGGSTMVTNPRTLGPSERGGRCYVVGPWLPPLWVLGS